MKYSGARILIEALVEEGVDTVFGFPGGAVLFIYDELYQHKDRIRHILTSHEQHAAHAADGYARSTGKVGVCIATSGPGATNLITGIATAYMDSVPIVAFTGNVASSLLGKDSFQEVDITGISMPVVKHNWIIKNPAEIAETVRAAFLVAASGRPGPVLIDITKDASSELADWLPKNQRPAESSRLASVSAARTSRLLTRTQLACASDDAIAMALELIEASKRPIIYAGGGVIIANASVELKDLAERLSAPVTLSLMGLGGFPADHPLYTGLVGMHGSKASNQAIQQADLLIAVGARFSDRVTSKVDTFAPNAKILHFDIDPAEINKNVRSERSVVGDLKASLAKLLTKLPARLPTKWNGDIDQWKQLLPTNGLTEAKLPPRFILETIRSKAGKDAIIVTDVGQHQIWTAQFYPFERPRSFLSSGGLGTMGYGFGAAIGAKVANPDRPVVLVTGDGSFRMNCAEMATAVNYGLALIIIIMNNRVLGMVRQWQALFYNQRYSETSLNRPPDFMKLAEAYGFLGLQAGDEISFSAALSSALTETALGRSTLIEAFINSDEKVLPMVPGGKAIDDQIL